jgi:hypothetical protein
LRPEKQKENTRQRRRGGAMITAMDETHIFSNNCDFVSASEGDE